MEYRKLGNTGLEVSVLGFGASSLGGVFHQVDPDECVKTVWAALDGGINFFDVSPAYGETLAEVNLGKALKGIARDRYYLRGEVVSIAPDAAECLPQIDLRKRLTVSRRD